MWKILLVISAVVLLGAGYLSYSNMEGMKETQELLSEQKDLKEQRLADLEKTNMEIAQLEQSIQSLDDEAEALETEEISLNAKKTETESSLKAQEANLADQRKKLDDAKETIGDIARIEALQREMIQIRTQIEESEIEVTQMEGAVAAAQVERDRLEKVAAEMVALRQDQQNGVIRGPFRSTVAKAYNEWGFVVVNGGNDQGVVKRAQLNVYRRGQPICRLLVTSVDSGQSAADIIPGSLAPGQTVQVGDMVTKAASASAAAVIPTGQSAASTQTPAQPDAEAPAADDPFGGGMGGGEAADPFGGGGMQGGSDAADPFGGGGSMDGGAADPFGGGSSEGAMEGGGAADPFGDGGTSAPDPFQ